MDGIYHYRPTRTAIFTIDFPYVKSSTETNNLCSVIVNKKLKMSCDCLLCRKHFCFNKMKKKKLKKMQWTRDPLVRV